MNMKNGNQAKLQGYNYSYKEDNKATLKAWILIWKKTKNFRDTIPMGPQTITNLK